MKLTKLVIAVAASAAICQAAAAQNAIANPSFNDGLAGWEVKFEGSLPGKNVWDARDAGGSNLSGSVLTVSEGGSFQSYSSIGSYVFQCVPVEGSGQIHAGGRFYVPFGAGRPGKVLFGLLTFTDSACTQNVYNANVMLDLDVTDQWVNVESYTFSTHPEEQLYARLTLGVFRTSGESLRAYWDDVHVTRKSGCRANNRYLCVNDNRFEVKVVARDPRTGNVAEGVVMKQKGVFGYFSLPGLTGDAGNAEVFLKVLDGRPVNGRFWVFYSGLTDLELTIDVENLDGLGARRYTKPGLVLASVADTSAF
jgi:hypothetical protein